MPAVAAMPASTSTTLPPAIPAIPAAPMPELAEDCTGMMFLGQGNVSCWLGLRPELAMRYNVFPWERATVAIDLEGRTLVCWGVQELQSPWTRDESIELPRSPNVD